MPSYLWLEPEAAGEAVSVACLAAAVMGLAVWAVSIGRGGRAVVRSLRYVRNCRQHVRETLSTGDSLPVRITQDPGGCIVLAGILHPEVFISPAVRRALPQAELSVALRHESAHAAAWDNLKRLLVLMSPDMFPFSTTLPFVRVDTLERGWAKFAEWAADDAAVAGSSQRSLSLAAALVRVARLGSAVRPSPLVTCLVESSAGLAARVDRLLRGDSPCEPSWGAAPLVAGTVASAALAVAAAVMLRPATLQAAHRALESLMR